MTEIADQIDDQLAVDAAPERSAEQIAPELEAILLMATEPMPAFDLAEAVGAPVPLVEQTLADLAEFYDESGRGFQLRNVGGGWRYATRPEHSDVISRWVIEGQQNKLTQAGLETLAVIAYMQPVARSRVSAVRGVNVDGVVRTLISRGLVSTENSDETTGAAMLRTTDYFLERMGLKSLADLPPIAPLLPEASELESELAALATPKPSTQSGPQVAPESDPAVATGSDTTDARSGVDSEQNQEENDHE